MYNPNEKRLKEIHKRLTTGRDFMRDYSYYRRCCDLIDEYKEGVIADREPVIAFITELSNEYQQLISICSLGRLEVKNVDANDYSDADLLGALYFFRDNIIFFATCKAVENMMK